MSYGVPHHRLAPGLAIALGVAWAAASASAQTTHDCFTWSSTQTENPAHLDSRAALALDPEERRHLVVWQAGRPETDTDQLWAQLLDENGAELLPADLLIQEGDLWWSANHNAVFDVAFDPTTRRYLVVWTGDVPQPVPVRESEIFGQWIDADGVPDGPVVQLTEVGIGIPTASSTQPSLVHNAVGGGFLLVFVGYELPHGGQVYGQFIGPDGSTTLDSHFAISHMGSPNLLPEGSPSGTWESWDFEDPTLAQEPGTGGYLVAWEAWRTDAEQGDYTYRGTKREIYAQRLDASGARIGPDDFRVSTTFDDERIDFHAQDPDIAFSPVSDAFLVVWSADESWLLPSRELEIFGQLVSLGGAEIGEDDFRISDMGPEGNPNYDAIEPAVTFHPLTGEFVVGWSGRDHEASPNNSAHFLQRLDASGAETGDHDAFVSRAGWGDRAISPMPFFVDGRVLIASPNTGCLVASLPEPGGAVSLAACGALLAALARRRGRALSRAAPAALRA